MCTGHFHAPNSGRFLNLRILHVIPGIAPRYGGPSTVIRPMVEALNRLPGITAEVATTDADGAGHRLSDEYVRQWAAPVHLFRRTFSERWKFSVDLWNWLQRHVADYDVVHVHAMWTFSTTAACTAARRHNIPVILRPCGMLSAYTWGRSAWQKRLYWRLVEQRNLASVRRFHVTSGAEAAEVERLHLPGGVRPVVIPHGIEPAAWETPADTHELRRRCGGGAGDRPIILFLSRLHPKKGIVDLLLPALARLRSDAFLAVVGGPDDHAPSYEEEVRSAVLKLGLKDRMALLGAVTAADRWALFDGAALFVLPSRSENFGVVVTEAMARGTPVVVSREVHACEHVIAAGAGRVVPLDIVALADAMDDLLAHPEARTAAGNAGRSYVREHLGWDKIILQVGAMYRDCLK